MFALTTSHTFSLYAPPCDMRKSFDSLCGLVTDELLCSPSNGTVYIFINRNRNKIKLLQWQSGGFVLYYKRLERGSFELPSYDSSTGSIKLNYSQLVLLIDGISITNLHRRKRFKKPRNTALV